VQTDYQGVMGLDGATVRFRSARDALVGGSPSFLFSCSRLFSNTQVRKRFPHRHPYRRAPWAGAMLNGASCGRFG
jgi:hypothetical protein